MTNRGLNRVHGKAIETEGTHDSGGRDDGGITISRRPNNRPSREKAPGPSKARATATTIIPKANSLPSCEPQEGAGNQEKANPRKHRPTKTPANGVNNPAAKAAPLAIKTKPNSHLPGVGLDGPERYRMASAAAVRPTATRNNNRPTPGLPSGNVEYSLCSANLPGAPTELHVNSRYGEIRVGETPHCGIFSYHLWGMRFAKWTPVIIAR
jgi:hypothetical protein